MNAGQCCIRAWGRLSKLWWLDDTTDAHACSVDYAACVLRRGHRSVLDEDKIWTGVNANYLHSSCRFKHNPYVNGSPPVRFYCGTPLIASNGHRLGTLCFADHDAHTFDVERCSILNNMAELCVREIERDSVIRRQSMESTEQLVSTSRIYVLQ